MSCLQSIHAQLLRIPPVSSYISSWAHISMFLCKVAISATVESHNINLSTKVYGQQYGEVTN